MDEKMRKRIEALSRMTTKNGASSNEEQIAQRKIEAMMAAQRHEKTFAERIKEKEIQAAEAPTRVNVYPMYETTSPEDAAFARQFDEIRRANRKKWNVR